MSFIDRLPRPEPLGQIPPLHAGPHSVENPVDHPPVITSPTATRTTPRQERLQPIPLRIRQIPTAHTASLGPTPHPRQEIRETVPSAVRCDKSAGFMAGADPGVLGGSECGDA